MIEENNSIEQKAAQTEREQILQCLIAEQAALQSARTSAITDTNARIYIFLLAIIGGSLVLAFVGQSSGATGQIAAETANQAISQKTNTAQIPNPIPIIAPTPTASPNAAVSAQISSAGAPFFWFGLMLFPALFFLGLTTFIHVLRTTMENTVHARGIARIRNFYSQVAPEVSDYLVHSIHDDRLETLHGFGAERSFLQSLVAPAGTVAFLNSILVGVWLAILLQSAFAPPVWLAAILGAFLFFVSLAAHHFYQSRQWEDFEAHSNAPKFPAETI
jgi:hypothetical protein